MSDIRQHQAFQRLFSDAEIARAILPYMAVVAPALGLAFNRAADAMIVEGNLPADAIEALHDLGHTLVCITEAMGTAYERSGAPASSSSALNEAQRR